MKHYSKSLDLLITAAQFARKGKHAEAAKWFQVAMNQKDLKPTLASLDALNGANLARAETAAATAGPARVARFLKTGKKTVANDGDIFNDTMDSMSAEEADVDDILELPDGEEAGTDAGNGESDMDVGQDDASDLDFSPTEELSFDDIDVSDLADLDDLTDEDFGEDDFGEEANTTGEGDVDSRPETVCDPEDLPEGETAPTPPPVPKAEDTTVTSKTKKPATAAPVKPAPIQRLNRVHSNLAALSKMADLAKAARAVTRPAKS